MFGLAYVCTYQLFLVYVCLCELVHKQFSIALTLIQKIIQKLNHPLILVLI